MINEPHTGRMNGQDKAILIRSIAETFPLPAQACRPLTHPAFRIYLLTAPHKLLISDSSNTTTVMGDATAPVLPTLCTAVDSRVGRFPTPSHTCSLLASVGILRSRARSKKLGNCTMKSDTNNGSGLRTGASKSRRWSYFSFWCIVKSWSHLGHN